MEDITDQLQDHMACVELGHREAQICGLFSTLSNRSDTNWMNISLLNDMFLFA